MKEKIHPVYGPARFVCACGNVIETRSTKKETVQVEICSACHPFFTGKQKLVDTAGRIDRFKKKFGANIVGTPKKVKAVAAPKAPTGSKGKIQSNLAGDQGKLEQLKEPKKPAGE